MDKFNCFHMIESLTTSLLGNIFDDAESDENLLRSGDDKINQMIAEELV